MRVLIISYHYAPRITARAFRWSAIGEYWTKNGNEVDVVCGWVPGLSREEVLNGVCVFRTGGSVIEALRKRLRVTGEGPLYHKTCQAVSCPKKANALLKALHDCTLRKIYWPDFAWIWYFSAKEKASGLLKKYHYDAMVTVSQPFTGHLVGLSLKGKYPDMKWTVDIGDPFCFAESVPINNYRLFKKLNYFSEKKVFEYADSISLTNCFALDRYAKIFSKCKGKLYVIPPLLSLPEKEADKRDLLLRDEKIRMVFVGTLYKALRNPGYLLKMFRNLLGTSLGRKLELHFWGEVDDCVEFFAPYKSHLDSKLFLHGLVNRDRAFQAMKSADILVNIGNSVPYHLPSKVVEYISTGKPILNLVRSTNDSSYEFFDKLPWCLTLFDNSESIVEQDLEKLQHFLECPPDLAENYIESLIQPFRIESIASTYQMLLK